MVLLPHLVHKSQVEQHHTKASDLNLGSVSYRCLLSSFHGKRTWNRTSSSKIWNWVSPWSKRRVSRRKREEYDKFVKDIDDFKRCMNDHHRVRLPVQEFKQMVNEVLKGHMYLILGFNYYTRHYRIRLPIPIHHDEQLGHKTGSG